jgi:hypothetical protein
LFIARQYRDVRQAGVAASAWGDKLLRDITSIHKDRWFIRLLTSLISLLNSNNKNTVFSSFLHTGSVLFDTFWRNHKMSNFETK